MAGEIDKDNKKFLRAWIASTFPNLSFGTMEYVLASVTIGNTPAEQIAEARDLLRSLRGDLLTLTMGGSGVSDAG